MRKPASRKIISDSVDLCETDVCFLHIQLLGTNVWLPDKFTQDSHRNRFWVFKISEVRTLKQSQPAPLWCISHMTTMLEVTRVVYMTNQTREAFVTSSGPFCDCSCKFVYRPQYVWSTNACQLQTFQDNLRAYFGQFSHGFQFFFFWNDGRQCMELRLCIIADLFCQPACKIARHISLHDLPYLRTM